MILESKRNVLGGIKGSLSVTIPIQWAKVHNIKKGDQLDVLGGKYLIVAREGAITAETKEQLKKIL